MKLKCDDVVSGLGCDYVATGATADEVHGAMMAHGGATHGELMEDKSAEEMMQAKSEMDSHIRQLLEAKG